MLTLPVVLALPFQAVAQYRGQPYSTNSTPVKVQGRVLNAATGTPIPRALVRINARTLLTDHEGKFLFEQVTDLSINLQVTKPGYSMSSDPSDPPNQFLPIAQITGPLELRLYPEALLTGTVTDPEGQPIPRLTIQARRSTFDELGHHWQISGAGQTNQHGEFRIPVPSGDYKLETRYVPRNSGDRDAVLPVTLPAPGSPSQVIHLRSGEEQRFDLHPSVRRTYPVPLSIEGSNERGFPQITARTSDGTSMSLGVMPSRTPGHATLFLPAGSYKLSARRQAPDSIEIAETSVTVTGHETVLSDADDAQNAGTVLRFIAIPGIPVELATDPAATSDNQNQQQPSGRGISSNGPANQVNAMQFGLTLQRIDPDADPDDFSNNVNLVNSRNSTPRFAAPPGTYRLVARGSGPWYIRSASYGASDLLSQRLVVAAGGSSAPIRLLVGNQTGSLQGTVTLKSQPTSGCWIYLIASTPSVTPVLTMRTNSDGTFNNPYMPPGTYQAVAFEHRHPADFTNPESLAPYATYVQSVTVTASGQARLNLTVVPQTEMQP